MGATRLRRVIDEKYDPDRLDPEALAAMSISEQREFWREYDERLPEIWAEARRDIENLRRSAYGLPPLR